MVDIDLVFLPICPRREALDRITKAMQRIGARIRERLQPVRVTENKDDEGTTVRLHVQAGRAQVKIEVSTLLRGTVYPPQIRAVSPAVEDAFGVAEMQVVDFADLYGGKLVAALDRQHPRDLFDVRSLLATEGLTDALRTAFLVYLISHDRPMHEVLSGRKKDLAKPWANGFDGMAAEPVSLADLTETQDRLHALLVGQMPDAHRDFLIGFERGAPDWSITAAEHVPTLPAVIWRQTKLSGLAPAKRAELVLRLARELGRSL